MRFLLLALALASAPLAAQTAPGDSVAAGGAVELVPGDASLDTSWLDAGEARYVIRLISPLQQDVGTVTERTTLTDGVATRVRTLSVPMQSLTLTDSLRADARTLAPLTHHSTGGPAPLALEFSSEGVVGMAGSEPVVVPLAAATYDASWIGEVAQSLPFAPGYTATVVAYDGQNGVVTYTLTVQGQEEASGGAGPVPAWIVEAASPAATVTYAIDAATRETLRTRFSPQPNVTLEIVRR